MNILSKPLVFVDIETTGLSPVRSRIIEVAAIRVEQGKVIQSFTKLVNPECEVPYFIQNLTGISEAEVQQAPLFADISDDLHQLLSDAVFVAHNVRFDYAFLRHEFGLVGKKIQPQLLCTMQLSRTLYPQHKSHKLEHLIQRHNLEYQARHRAYDDAHALWQFVQHLQVTFSNETLATAIARQLG